LPEFIAASEELPQDRALRLGAARLLSAVAALPLRYAPFYARLGELWQVPEAHVQRELARAQSPRNWHKTLVPGLKTFTLTLPEPTAAARAHLLRFEPGVTFPEHRHHGTERVLVLEGSYADDRGREVRAGDEQTMRPSSDHRLRILGDVPCVAAVSERGVSFVAPWLDRLTRPFRR
jgi:anti-sigma factor ChrR (cupin superfamily)